MTRGSEVFLSVLLLGSMIYCDSLDIVPLPTHPIQWSNKTVLLGNSIWSIVLSPNPDSLSQYGATRLQKAFKKHGLKEPIVVSSDPGANAIYIGTVANAPANLVATIKMLIAKGDSLQAQGYSLAFQEAEKKVFILGRDGLGALYGVTTLEQLMQGQEASAHFIGANIRDWPHFKHRVFGSMCGIAYKVTFEAYQQSFVKHINDYLVPNRINVIPMRKGGRIFYHKYSLRSNTQENRKRLKWAVAEARKYGIEVEYYDKGACGWDFQKKVDKISPYDEIIWSSGQECFYCYSHENLIRKIAGEMGQFMGEAGIRHLYLHLHDANGQSMQNKWNNRCSECQKRWPTDSDTPHAQFGEAQANLGNIYYDELKKHVPDLVMSMVQTQYTGDYPEYQKTVHENLNPNINVLLRERPASTVTEMRQWYGNGARPFYYYILDDSKAGYMMHDRFTNARNYYVGNERDHYFGPSHGDSHILDAMHIYYAWNVYAPGNSSDFGAINVYEIVENLKNPLNVTRRVLDHVAKHALGEKWGPKAVQASLTWLVPGFFNGQLRGKRLESVMSAFPQLASVPSSQKRQEFIKLQMNEAEHMEPIAEGILSEPDVPYGMHEWSLYGLPERIMTCRLLAEPMYWEAIANSTKKKEDYVKGYQVVQNMMARLMQIYMRVPSDCNTRGRLAETLDKLSLYASGFAITAGMNIYFRNPVAVVMVWPGFDALGYRIEYINKTTSTASLRYVEKPAWIQAKDDSVYGKPIHIGLDSVLVELRLDNTPMDTMKLYIHTIEPFSYYPQDTPTRKAALQSLHVPTFGIHATKAGMHTVNFLVGIDRPGPLTLAIYNVLGQRIWHFHKPNAGKGYQQIAWNWNMQSMVAANCVYFAALQQKTKQSLHRFALLR